MSNLKARAALERAQALFLQRPALGISKSAAATARWRDGLRFELAGPHGETIVTDMPASLGGGDAGVSPGWLLRASLATCTATAIAMRAALRGIEPKSIEVAVENETDVRGACGVDGADAPFRSIRMTIRVVADDADADALREIAQWAGASSPVSLTVQQASPVALDVTVESVATARE